jgi:phage-related protein
MDKIGILTINNTSIEVLETGITINCEAMECTKNNLNMNASVILDDFPKLSPGSNTITLGTGITDVSIRYYERWL